MKQRFPRRRAEKVAAKIIDAMSPFCHRIEVAGSIRRRKEEVGDIEIVYVPKVESRVVDRTLFGEKRELIDTAIEPLNELILAGSLRKRPNELGREAFGPLNKLMVAVKTGIPVDLFATRGPAWFNYLVCRTGSGASNIRIAAAAKAKGWKWHPYDVGFTDEEGNWVIVESEEDVFNLVGLPCPPPEERE